ncbi:MAG: SRPBCC family protein [Rhodothermales bacterium]
MRALYTDIEIHASPEAVWAVLTQLSRYDTWNPFITRAEGRVRVGERLTVRLEPPGGKPMTFRPTVTRVTNHEEFRWLGRLLFRGLFDGEHIFELEALDGHRVRLIHREEFRGLLVPLLWKRLDTSTREGFEAMNRALKERAEALAGAGGG